MQVRSLRSALAAVAVGVVGAVAAGFILWGADPARAKPFATLDVMAGSAEIRRGGQQSFRPVSDGVGLRPGDTIKTPSDGRASIEYFDGSVTRLDYGTTFTIQELASEPNGGTVIDALQTSGSTFHRVQELTSSQGRFDVEAPTATASVRGTTFFAQVGADGGALFGVIEGEVLITGEEGAARLIPGRGVDVSSGGVLGSTFMLTPEMLGSDWLYYNLCVLDRAPGACREVEPKTVKQMHEPDGPSRTPEQNPTAEPTTFAAVPVSEESGAQGKDQGADNHDPPQPPAPDPSPPPDPPPPEPPPETPPETPSEHPGSPPCDNPGNGTPCDGPGHAGNPPGHE